MSNPPHDGIADRVRTIPPKARVHLTWLEDDTAVQTEGTVTDYDPQSAYRRIETETRTLTLTSTDPDTIQVDIVTETGTTAGGPLSDIRLLEQPVETLRLTDDGVEVPSSLVGYTGFLRVETETDYDRRLITPPGLQTYDNRLLGGFLGELPDDLDQQISVRPTARPCRTYELVDDRTNTTETQEMPTPAQLRYGDIVYPCDGALALLRTVDSDDSLTDSTRETAHDHLEEINRLLTELRGELVDATYLEPAPPTTGHWEDYETALVQLEIQVESLHQRLVADPSLPDSQTDLIDDVRILSHRIERLDELLETAVNRRPADD